MNNKLCVITGANSGIGFETTKALAKQGAYIVMVCRNEDKAEAARQQIIDETSNPGIEIVLCDFAIQSEIRTAAEHIKKNYEKIDVLINNHGFVAAEREETVDGLEKTFAVNHIGYFLFTNLLLDHIKASDYARIVSVASEAHKTGEFNPENIQLSEGFSPMKAYGNSKLFNILFTKELAHRLTETHVTANCLHPGVVASNFAQSGSWLLRTFFTIGKLFMVSPKKGAQTSIYLATSDDVENVNGAYFKNEKAATPSKTARDADAAAELWKMSEKLCGM
ncbi:MAG: retinol dehydrogenase [Balneola sp.]|jgi:NAD(P)-dependent dehydrogenase (short-subunit alcohol dehydrogenase family)|nr:retinol dehydrogenase [Balneola sp.]MBE80001.1 retinol dehydrogenase [Balneola sp.]|tara:strand:- start:26577 stop:27413 length:837 start_codon:yes stop_codon:yes gene_type:complete